MSGKTCCGGSYNLREGVRIIAVLSFILGIFEAGVAIYYMTVISEYQKAVPKLPIMFDEVSNTTLFKLVMTYLVFGFILALLEIVLSSMLFDGAHTNQASKCRPWLYYNYFLFGGIFFIYINMIIIFVIFLGGIGVLITFMSLLPLCIYGYLVNVVCEYIIESSRHGVRGN